MEEAPLEFFEWTKRLGQKHWAKGGEAETLCGMPMLGNNYAEQMDPKWKESCEECIIKKEEYAEEERGRT